MTLIESATWLIRLHTFCQDSSPLADLMHSLARVTLWYASPRLQLLACRDFVTSVLLGLKMTEQTEILSKRL